MILLRLSCVTAVLVSFALPALAQTACNIPAFVRPNLAGAPVVVDAPADGAAHLGAMPMVDDPAHGLMGAEAVITEVKNGFAAVSAVAEWNGAVSPLEGWVAARDMVFVVQTTKGFAAPDPAAQVVWAGEAIYPDMIASIEDCKGEWVAVTMADPQAVSPVWVRGACAGQDATCAGVSGD